MEDKLTCYIIDDEPLALEILEEYIARVPFLEHKGSFRGPLVASGPLEKEKPDLIFLDVNMSDLDGLSFISMIKHRPTIILTTAYDEYAIKAFDLEVSDYLLKPISFERFYKGVLRIYQNQFRNFPMEKEEQLKIPAPEKEYIFLNVGQRIQKIRINEILFIEAMRDYLRVHTTENKFMILSSFAKLEENLPSTNFVRAHRSYMVSIDKIDHIEGNRIRIGDQVIKISGTYKENFLKVWKSGSMGK